MDWKIHYGDGSTFSSDDGRWEDAPGYNVQAIPVADDVTGRTVEYGWDYYVIRDGQPMGCDLPGLLDYLINEVGVVKQGRSLSNKHFQEVYQKAAHDPDFPLKHLEVQQPPSPGLGRKR